MMPTYSPTLLRVVAILLAACGVVLATITQHYLTLIKSDLFAFIGILAVCGEAVAVGVAIAALLDYASQLATTKAK